MPSSFLHSETAARRGAGRRAKPGGIDCGAVCRLPKRSGPAFQRPGAGAQTWSGQAGSDRDAALARVADEWSASGVYGGRCRWNPAPGCSACGISERRLPNLIAFPKPAAQLRHGTLARQELAENGRLGQEERDQHAARLREMEDRAKTALLETPPDVPLPLQDQLLQFQQTVSALQNFSPQADDLVRACVEGLDFQVSVLQDLVGHGTPGEDPSLHLVKS